MASQDDILTAHKNNVVAINGFSNTMLSYTNKKGSTNSGEVSSSKLVKNSSGWIANISVIVAGSTNGFVYDTNSITNISGNRLLVIPNTVGIYVIQMPCNSGIVVVPGTSQVVAVSYT